MRRLALTIVVLAALALPATAAAKVSLVGLSPARPGSDARLTVAVVPAATCSIVVRYKSGPSKAKGLGPKRPAGGRVSWTWRVGTNTTPGRWPVDVTCGPAGSLRAWLVVRR